MHGNEQKKWRGFPVRSQIVTIAMFCMLLLAACGQKGDLYLPDEGQTGQQQAK